MSYETFRNPHLPWGYWLLALPNLASLEDDVGRHWGSVREAFWGGRLGMDVGDSRIMHQQLEFMLGILAAYDRRIVTSVEAVHDMFAGDHDYQNFYKYWLHSHGLIANEKPGRPLSAPLTAEGRAVLVMLASTRPPELGMVPVGPEAVRAMDKQRPDRREREQWFQEVEAVAVKLPFRFRRDVIWHKPAIVLVGDGLGEVIPLRRTLWSLLLSDEESRDRFYYWLCARLDRWGEWGKIAYGRGAPDLTQHILALVATEMPDFSNGRPPVLAIGHQS